MLNLHHPDFLANQTAVKQITRGGRQAADDKAMEAMWQALDEGRSKEEAEKVFNDTYKKGFIWSGSAVKINYRISKTGT